MIHMSQVKVPVKELVKKAEPELLCKGKIGKAEEELVKKAAAKLIKMPIEEITFSVLKKNRWMHERKTISNTFIVSLYQEAKNKNE